jgi:hypothetical protein
MAHETPRPGRLIAVEGSRGVDVGRNAQELAERLRARGIDVGISRWDASGLFADLLLAESTDVVVSPRMLALMYAADLVFRLRWEIQPALAEGRVVIAAPYVETAIGIGVALALPEAWLHEVFRFAPAADLTQLARERKPGRGWRPHASRGFGEFSAMVLANSAAGFKRRAARDRAMEWLAETLEPRVTRRKALVASLTGYEHPAGKAEPSARAASQRT